MFNRHHFAQFIRQKNGIILSILNSSSSANSSHLGIPSLNRGVISVLNVNNCDSTDDVDNNYHMQVVCGDSSNGDDVDNSDDDSPIKFRCDIDSLNINVIDVANGEYILKDLLRCSI